GIGRCLANELSRRGARLVLAARSQDKLDELARPLGASVMAVSADVTSTTDRRRLLDTVAECFGGLDVLVNSAGVGSFGHFAESSEAVLRQVMEVNFFAPAELMRAALPL